MNFSVRFKQVFQESGIILEGRSKAGILIRRYVNSIDPEVEIILYGSRTRGEEHADSDWDVLVLTDFGVDLKIERKFRNKLYNLELETGEPFSIFAYSKKD